jgi:hypothetical protein
MVFTRAPVEGSFTDTSRHGPQRFGGGGVRVAFDA